MNQSSEQVSQSSITNNANAPDINEEVIECNYCEWKGKEDNLIRLTENINDLNYSFCPECEAKL